MASIASSLICKPVKNCRNYQEDLRFLRQLTNLVSWWGCVGVNRGTIVQRGEGASFGPREWGLTTMDRDGWECDI